MENGDRKKVFLRDHKMSCSLWEKSIKYFMLVKQIKFPSTQLFIIQTDKLNQKAFRLMKKINVTIRQIQSINVITTKKKKFSKQVVQLKCEAKIAIANRT